MLRAAIGAVKRCYGKGLKTIWMGLGWKSSLDTKGRGKGSTYILPNRVKSMSMSSTASQLPNRDLISEYRRNTAWASKSAFVN